MCKICELWAVILWHELNPRFCCAFEMFYILFAPLTTFCPKEFQMFFSFVNAGVQKWRIFVCIDAHFPSFNWWKIWFYANRGNIEKKSMHWKEIGETDGAQILMALLCNESPMSPLLDGFPCLFLPATVFSNLPCRQFFNILFFCFCVHAPLRIVAFNIASMTNTLRRIVFNWSSSHHDMTLIRQHVSQFWPNPATSIFQFNYPSWCSPPPTQSKSYGLKLHLYR